MSFFGEDKTSKLFQFSVYVVDILFVAACSTPSFPNGNSKCPSGSGKKETCTFSCGFGYHLVGYSISTCVQNDQGQYIWDPPLPKCQGKCSQYNLYICLCV